MSKQTHNYKCDLPSAHKTDALPTELKEHEKNSLKCHVGHKSKQVLPLFLRLLPAI